MQISSIILPVSQVLETGNSKVVLKKMIKQILKILRLQKRLSKKKNNFVIFECKIDETKKKKKVSIFYLSKLKKQNLANIFLH